MIDLTVCHLAFSFRIFLLSLGIRNYLLGWVGHYGYGGSLPEYFASFIFFDILGGLFARITSILNISPNTLRFELNIIYAEGLMVLTDYIRSRDVL